MNPSLSVKNISWHTTTIPPLLDVVKPWANYPRECCLKISDDVILDSQFHNMEGVRYKYSDKRFVEIPRKHHGLSNLIVSELHDTFLSSASIITVEVHNRCVERAELSLNPETCLWVLKAGADVTCMGGIKAS